MREKTLNNDAKAIRTLTIGDPLSGQEVEQADTGQVGRASIYQPAQLKQPHNYIKTVKKLSNFFFYCFAELGQFSAELPSDPFPPSIPFFTAPGSVRGSNNSNVKPGHTCDPEF